MDAFDYAEPTKAPPKRNVSGLLWNILTVLALIGVCGVGGLFFYLFTNPYASINPFPPPTDIPTATASITPSPTAAKILPPTWTPTVPPEPTATETPRPSSTPYITDTPVVTTALQTAGATEPSVNSMPFVIQQGSPAAISGQPFHPEAGCNWMGVTGYVFDLRGGQVNGQEVHLGGTVNGAPLQPEEMVTLTGLLRNDLGSGYFEFTIGDKPIASSKTLWIQLVAQGGLPMSDKFYFDTYDVCDKNMVIINFQQVR